MNHFMLITILVVTPFFTNAQNKTLPKWEKAYRNYRIRNHQKNMQKFLQIAQSEHRPDYYNDKYNNYDYHPEGYQKKSSPYPEDSYEEERSHFPDYQAKNHAGKDKDSEEEYEYSKERQDSYEAGKKHYHPYEDPYYKRDNPSYSKSRYNPEHLHDNVPLYPFSKVKYVTPAYTVRPFRNSHYGGEKPSYDLKEQNIHPKYDYNHYHVKPKEKYPYRPYYKQDYPSSSKYEDTAYSNHHHEPYSGSHSYHTSYGYQIRRPDPYYTSGTYYKDKTFGVDLDKHLKNSYNSSRHHPSYYGERNHFVPSYGPPGFMNDKYSSKNYYPSFDSKEANSYERDHISSPGSTFTSQASVPLHSEKIPFDIKKENIQQASVVENSYKLKNPSKDDYHSAPLPDVAISSIGPQNEPDVTISFIEPQSDGNSSRSFNNTKNVFITLLQSSEDSSIKVTPPYEDLIPQCAEGTESSFCFHDTHYPFAKIRDAISSNRKHLLNLLSEVKEDKFGKIRPNNTHCQSTIKSGSLLRAKNTQNIWKIIVKLPQSFDSNHYIQNLQLELCDHPGSLCDSNTKTITRCYQKYQMKKLLSWSPEESLHMDRFRLPVFCVCRPEKHKKKQEKHKIANRESV